MIKFDVSMTAKSFCPRILIDTEKCDFDERNLAIMLINMFDKKLLSVIVLNQCIFSKDEYVQTASPMYNLCNIIKKYLNITGEYSLEYKI